MMKFKSPPVNSLSLEFLTEFSISLEKLENNRACRGVIITSVSVRSCWVADHWNRRALRHLRLAQGGGFWKASDFSSVPFSSRRTTTKCCALS